MSQGVPPRGSAILAVILMVVGTAMVLVTLGSLWLGGDSSNEEPPSTTTAATDPPVQTATEPILPPPPTGTPPVISVPTEPILRSTDAALPILLTPSPSGPTLIQTTSVVTTVQLEPSPELPATVAASATPSTKRSPSPTSEKPTTVAPEGGLYSLRQRLGLGVGNTGLTEDVADRLGLGWYVDWWARPDRYRSTDVEYMPMIRLERGVARPGREVLRAVAEAQPGALWLIGNEPDVKWQDNVTPADYARAYYELYYFLKAIDPTCEVAIGGVSQPTPLRLRYLDLILQAYESQYGEPMPVDVWNVHNFVLREERDSWGVDIPPGMSEQTGSLYEIADHDDLQIFQEQIIGFRRWMKERGQQSKPLIVSEYGILMPAEYGFPPQRVEEFMLGTFEYFRTATDPHVGFPADGYRLVQRWCWFSLADERYPTGNLVFTDSGELTPLGEAFSTYAGPASE